VAGNKPVDPYTTLFNLGSIGKIYTFTAVMQLVEQGKLDLNEDINAYLDFKIPATYPEPITMAHLRSHSAGLDEFFFGTTAPSAEDVLLLGEYLRTHLPPRVRPPGVVSGYTNYGVALAGHIALVRPQFTAYSNVIVTTPMMPSFCSNPIADLLMPAPLFWFLPDCHPNSCTARAPPLRRR
jgi:hypothetical protein